MKNASMFMLLLVGLILLSCSTLTDGATSTSTAASTASTASAGPPQTGSTQTTTEKSSGISTLMTPSYLFLLSAIFSLVFFKQR